MRCLTEGLKAVRARRVLERGPPQQPRNQDRASRPAVVLVKEVGEPVAEDPDAVVGGNRLRGVRGAA